MTDFVKLNYPVEWNDLPRYERKKKIKELKTETVQKAQTVKKIKKYLWIGIAVILLVLGYKWLTYKSPEQVKFDAAVKSASLEGKVQEFPSEGQDHVSNGTAVSYKTNPPTSGTHYVVPEPWGVYDREIPDGAAVHGLEHGGIWISYKDISDDEKKILEKIGKDNSGSVIVSPRSADDTKIAVASWGRYMKMNSADAALIQKYIDTYRNQGPEKLAN